MAKTTFTKNTGTVGFMAPEVCSPTDKGYSCKADIWSFGMVLYEMMTLALPYSECPQFDVWGVVVKGQRPSLACLGEQRSEELMKVVKLFMRCTEHVPDERPTTKQIIAKLAAV
eukprot:TRINITY_DN59_c0_g2_i2.p2 TRINITY_DN59_c0_g2~~TRINITY_DN59_c0_g2_i2.p2  ORF type:complete len:114 (-),score=28.11 TRINITY_DN59_c0_g2_i2:106-447(-)